MKKLDDAIKELKEIEKDFHGYGRWSENARKAIKLIEDHMSDGEVMSRGAFEKWYAENGMVNLDILKIFFPVDRKSFNVLMQAQAQVAWQAALESQSARCPHIETSGTTSWCRLAARPKVPDGCIAVDIDQLETLKGLLNAMSAFRAESMVDAMLTASGKGE